MSAALEPSDRQITLSYYELHSNVLDFVTKSDYTHDMLQKYKKSMSVLNGADGNCILESFNIAPPLNAVMRQKIESGQVDFKGETFPISTEIKTEILKMSDELQLDEMKCFEYWWMASQKENCDYVEKYLSLPFGSLKNNIPDAARKCFFVDINLLLQTFVQIMNVCSCQDVESGRRSIILQDIFFLLRKGLVKTLTSCLLEKFPPLMLNNAVSGAAITWRESIVDCLFQITYISHLSLEDVKLLLKLLISYSNEFSSMLTSVQRYCDSTNQNDESLDDLAKKINADDNIRLSSHYRTLLMIQLVFIASLEHDVALFCCETLTESTESRLKGPAAISELHSIIFESDVSWKNETFHGISLFAWMIFLSGCGTVVTEGVAPTSALPHRISSSLSSISEKMMARRCFSNMSKLLHNGFMLESSDSYRLLATHMPQTFYMLLQKYALHLKVHPSEYPKCINQLVLQSGNAKIGSEQDCLEDILEFSSVIISHDVSKTKFFWENGGKDEFQCFLLSCSHITEKDNSLFVPFIRLITAASRGSEKVAEAAFQFVKKRPSRLSWDHFFLTLQRYPTWFSQSSAVFGASKNISPQDIDCLIAILELLQSMCAVETLCLIFYQNQKWATMQTLFNLLKCPVEPRLKGSLMKTISMFARCDQLKSQIWCALEGAQILVTCQSNSFASAQGAALNRQAIEHHQLENSGVSGGIRYELDQVESLNRTYPSTLGFTYLIYELMAGGLHVPDDLGAGYRVPGANPYFEFLLQHVLLRFDVREYKNNNEKWLMAAGVLHLIKNILEDFSVDPSEFSLEESWIEVPGASAGEFSKAGPQLHHLEKPRTFGFELMQKLCSDSDLLRKILSIVSSGEDSDKMRMGSTESFETARAMASLFKWKVGKRQDFSSIPVSSMRDHCIVYCLEILKLAIMKQATFISLCRDRRDSLSCQVEPLHRLIVHILPHRYLVNISKLVVYFREVRVAYLSVEILALMAKNTSGEDLVCALRDSGELEDIMFRYSMCLTSFRNSASCFQHPDLPEMSSFERRLPVLTEIEMPLRHLIIQMLLVNLSRRGISISHLLLGMIKEESSNANCLETVLDLLSSVAFISENSSLAASCFQLLYELCHNRATSEKTFHLLDGRGHHKGFCLSQLNCIPTYKKIAEKNEISESNSIAMIKIRSWILRIVALHLHVRTSIQEYNSSYSSSLLNSLLTTYQNRAVNGKSSSQILMVEILNETCVYVQPPELPDLGLYTQTFFRVAEQCVETKDGSYYFDVRNLNDRVRSHSQLAKAPLEQLRRGLHWAVEYSSYSSRVEVEKKALSAWGEALQVVLQMPYNCLKQLEEGIVRTLSVILDTLLDMLKNCTNSEIFILISQYVLALFSKLREVSALERADGISLGLCQRLLQGLVSGVYHSQSKFDSSAPSSAARRNLYSCLLHLIHYVQSDGETSLEAFEKTAQCVIDEGFIEILQQDVGDEYSTCICLSLLESMVFFEKTFLSMVLNSLCAHGALQDFIMIFRRLAEANMQLSGLKNTDDEDKKASLRSRIDWLRVVFGTSMSLFTRIAEKSPKGASKLLDYGLITQLTAYCEHFLPKSRIRRSAADDSSLYELWMPIIRCLKCLLISLPSQHTMLMNQMCDFLNKTHKIVNGCFKLFLEGNLLSLNLINLRELKCVSFILLKVILSPDSHDIMIAKLGTKRLSKYVDSMRQILVFLGYSLTAHLKFQNPSSDKSIQFVTKRHGDSFKWLKDVKPNETAEKMITAEQFDAEKVESVGAILCNISIFLHTRACSILSPSGENIFFPASAQEGEVSIPRVQQSLNSGVVVTFERVLELLLDLVKLDLQLKFTKSSSIMSFIESISSLLCQHLVAFEKMRLISPLRIKELNEKLYNVLNESKLEENNEFLHLLLRERRRSKP